MRTIDWSNAIKKDYKRVAANPRHARNIDDLLRAVLNRLVADEPLPESCRDHALVGNWKNHRECHIKPDLLLIYKQQEDSGVLELTRLGSHSELFS
jgi:mRNA interferase YafQ